MQHRFLCIVYHPDLTIGIVRLEHNIDKALAVPLYSITFFFLSADQHQHF
jgi:hypothetical protein